MTAMQRSEPAFNPRGLSAKQVNLALQGGGAHGAFTWGVLDYFLESGLVNWDGICGTSAGAVNAVVAAHGKHIGGTDGAREALQGFWKKLSELGDRYNPVHALKVPPGLPGYDPRAVTQVMHFWLESYTRIFSPYQFNPVNYNPLRGLLLDAVDFDLLRQTTATKIYLAATNVRTGKVRVFSNAELTVDAVLASACLPQLFQAVEINGEHYWDGGFMGNPVLYPLFYESVPDDIVIVHINPIYREKVPETSVEIADRVNEISFNSSLMREMRAIAFAARMVEQGWLKDEYQGRVRRMLIHSIRNDALMGELSQASKYATDWHFLTGLRDRGRAAAARFIRDHHRDLGVRTTVDIRKEFL